MPPHGTTVPRGQERPPAGGRFGTLFELDPCEADEAALSALARLMAGRQRPLRQNPHVPAGFTYLGQFVDHDITFDPVSKVDQINDPHALANFRTPRLDLDSVYGGGPVAQPYLYDWEDPLPHGVRLLVGRGADGVEDLPRNHQGRALIGDARNDENRIVAQLHLAFLRFHNAVVAHLAAAGTPEEELLDAAQRLVRWHYQWIVLHEFLPKVVGADMAGRVLVSPGPGAPEEVRREHFRWEGEPFIPVEFSGAAYRFGHSMVRDRYRLNAIGRTALEKDKPLFPDLQGLEALTHELVIDWREFFEIGRRPDPQLSLQVDTGIVKPLFNLPDRGRQLPALNLLRGRSLCLPSGQSVAEAMELPALEARDLRLGDDPGGALSAAQREVLERSTPLWYYVLCEAEKQAAGAGARPPHLGPVGGRIVAEVLVGLVEGDASSYLACEPAWRPSGLGVDRDFTMADLLEIARRGVAAPPPGPRVRPRGRSRPRSRRPSPRRRSG